MKKYFFLILFYCFFLSSFSQNPELPNFNPPSPTPFQLTQFGDIPVNMHLGVINPSIDLYNYKAGALNVPISMSYNGNGVKVDQPSSWTGINWNLNAGGVITRTVRDLDDLKYSRLIRNSQELNDLIQNGNQQTIRNQITSGTIDSEIDLFSFSFGGYSGSFYLDPFNNNEPTLTKYDTELDIEFIGSITNYQLEIVITDPNGIQYFFGGPSATESTQLIYQGEPFNTIPTSASSFYLTKIKHYNGDEVYFDYDTVNFYEVSLSKREYVSIETNRSMTNECSYISIPLQYYEIQPSLISNRIYSGRFLSKIHSNITEESVDFLTENAPNGNSNSEINRFLTSLKINKNSSEVKQYMDFSYLFPRGFENAPRFFLEEVKFKDKTQTQTEKKYTFQYEDPTGLPDRFSFSQDHFGFFNGKINSRLIPNTSYEVFDGLNNLANRSADFQYAKKGSLKKITYPTGGTTEFEYESPKIHDVSTSNGTASVRVYNNSSSFNPPDQHNQLSSFGNQEDVPSQIADVSVGIFTDDDLTNHAELILKTRNLSTQQVIEEKRFLLYQFLDDNTGQFSTTLYLDVENNNGYSIEAVLDPGQQNNNTEIDVSVTLHYNYSESGLVDGPGMRIKQTIDNPIDGPEIEKVYYYKTLEDIVNDNEVSEGIYTPTYISDQQQMFLINCSIEPNHPPLPLFVYMKKISSSSLNSTFLTNYDKIAYENVTISYGGENFENGGKQMTFRLMENKYPNDYIFSANEVYRSVGTTNNNASLNGTLEKEFTFKNKNNTFYKINETINQYNISNFKSTLNNQCFLEYEILSAQHAYDLSGLYLGIYKLYSFKFSLSNKKNIQYFGNVPYDAQPTSNNSITNETNYTYGNVQGLPIESATTNSKGQKMISKSYYPENSSGIGLSSNEANTIENLKSHNQHRLTEPIQVETYLDRDSNNSTSESELVSRKRTVYGPLGNISPSRVEIQKGTVSGSTTLESRIEYHNYDSRGNPLELSQADGMRISYFWGYDKRFPIAKIENASYQEIASALGTTVSNLYYFDETDLATLNNLRDQMSGAMVTTYTFDPSIGVTTMTDTRGYQTTYHYDEFNRLEFVKDQDGNVLSKNEYRYKNN